MQKAKYSSAKEPISTQYANKGATQMLDTIKKQISSQLSKTIASISVPTVKEITASNSVMSCLLTALKMAGKTKPVSFDQGREYLTTTKLSQCKNTQNTLTKLRGVQTGGTEATASIQMSIAIIQSTN
jgi:hypothetical protein